MKIGIYDPYLNTLGGGENYILTIASYLSSKHTVNLFWDEKEVLEKAQSRFNIDLSHIKLASDIFSKHTSLIEKFLKTNSYDVIIFMSDGSIPFLFGKKNILIVQHPLPWVKTSVMTQVKLKMIDTILVYSDFVRQFIDHTFNFKSTILAPAVTPVPSTEKQKKNMILTVGRFTQGMNTKKQAEMIELFKKFYDAGNKEWKFVLIGATLPEDESFIISLKKNAVGYPIEIVVNAPYQTLLSYYQQAKIYWHAAGIGEDLKKYPERAEHFGITTVEAMSAGAVPVVIAAGGQPEIVTNGEDGYLWETGKELIEKTAYLAHNKQVWQRLSDRAQSRAQDFQPKKFYAELDTIIK